MSRAMRGRRRISVLVAGPGELGGLYGMAWLAPDTFLVVDPGNARLAPLTVDGEQVEQWGWARLGSVWARYTLGSAPDTLEIPSPGSLGLELAENLELCRGNGGLGVFSNPYAASLIRVPAPTRERAVAMSSVYEIAFLDPADDTVRVVSRDVEPVPLPDSVRSSLEADQAEFRAQWRGADCEGEVAGTDVLPVLHDLYFDHHGRLLVEYNRPDGVAFDLYDGDGRWIGTFAAPDRDTSVPPYLHGHRLYTVTRDSLEIQRVQVHRLVALEG